MPAPRFGNRIGATTVNGELLYGHFVQRMGTTEETGTFGSARMCTSMRTHLGSDTNLQKFAHNSH